MFTFEAESGIAGTAFTTADVVVAAWGTLDAAGTRLVYHSGRGASAAAFTWSAGVSGPTVAPTAPLPTASPTTKTPTYDSHSIDVPHRTSATRGVPLRRLVNAALQL